jgi:phosphatidylglycerol:prolipoprotein diacylglycerol transferase
MHPIAFQLGSLTIKWYGVMVALGFLAGLWTASRRGLREGVAAEQIIDLGPWLIVGTIVGARTLYVISYWHEFFAGKPIAEIFMVWNGGLVYYGGLIGASLACILYTRVKKLRLWRIADILAPSIALGCVFGRIGCLLNGCCYGRACNLPWAIRFPEDILLDPPRPTYPVHPTQVYDSLLNLGLYLALAWLYRRKKFDGQVFGVYLVSYAVLRSFVELFRGDYYEHQHYLGGWATPAHLMSIAIFAAGLVLLRLLPRPEPKRE